MKGSEEGISEKVHIEAVELGNKFWIEFSILCERTLNKLSDQQYRDWFEAYLDNKTSIYGRKKQE